MRLRLWTMSAVGIMLAGALGATGENPAYAAPESAPCRTKQLAGAFTVEPGSAGAGHISYELVLRNRSLRTCQISGYVRMQLLDGHRRPLPTTVVHALPPGVTTVKVTLRPGQHAGTTVRFSPNVPGPGEPTRGRCEPVARFVALTPPGQDRPILTTVTPPTSVCGHGHLGITPLSFKP
jgi:Protein of unknown function (DUF4232)